MHHINSFSNIKNVYFGNVRGAELVYKKLGHDDEIAAVDGYLCNGGLTKCGEFTKAKFCTKSSENDGWVLLHIMQGKCSGSYILFYLT